MAKRSSLFIAAAAALSLAGCSLLAGNQAKMPVPQKGDADSVADCLQTGCKSIVLSFGQFAISAVKPEQVKECGDVKLVAEGNATPAVTGKTFYADHYRDRGDGFLKLKIRQANAACL